MINLYLKIALLCVAVGVMILPHHLDNRETVDGRTALAFGCTIHSRAEMAMEPMMILVYRTISG